MATRKKASKITKDMLRQIKASEKNIAKGKVKRFNYFIRPEPKNIKLILSNYDIEQIIEALENEQHHYFRLMEYNKIVDKLKSALDNSTEPEPKDKLSLWSKSHIRKPAIVKFTGKDGKLKKFNAHKIIAKPIKVNFKRSL